MKECWEEDVEKRIKMESVNEVLNMVLCEMNENAKQQSLGSLNALSEGGSGILV